MLKRKIESVMEQWKNDPDHLPLVIKGCRQCGKTYSVKAFAAEHYKNIVYMNFYEHKEYKSIFEGSLDIDHLVMLMSALMGPGISFEPNETVIIFDEIQECPQARTSLKFFQIDGRYDVIGTGSLLGVKGYGEEEPRSYPTGYETMVDMYPLDFEEFLWSKGIQPEVIQLLRESMEKTTPVPSALHERFRQLLLQYLVVGGMPAAVDSFIQHNDMGKVLTIQRDILRLYENDMMKYADRRDRPRIIECFESIPRQLAKENKKFQYSLVKKGGRSSQYVGSLQWIEDAGIILRCHNLTITELPLEGNSIPGEFKVYMMDPGLFTAMLDEGTQFDILSGKLLTYKGAITESFVAGALAKLDRKLYYYRSDSGLELDFIIRFRGKCTPVECKATTGNTKSSRTVLNHYEKYHVDQIIKLGDYNIGFENQILTLPMYMTFLLNER